MAQNYVNRLAGLASGNGAGNVIESPEAKAAKDDAALLAMFARKKGKKSKKGAAAVEANLVVAPENRPRTLLDIITNGRFPELELFFIHNPDFDVRSLVPVPNTERSEPLLIHVLDMYTKERAKAYERMVALLLARGADPNQPSQEQQEPIFFAIGKGNLTIVRALLDAGANMERRSRMERHNASGYVNLNNRNNGNNGNNNNNNPLNRIQINNANNIADLPFTPILYAIKLKHWDIVNELLRRGARININKLFPGPFTNNVGSNDYEALLDLETMTLLMIAIGLDDQELFDACLERGADVNIQTEEGASALILAAGLGNAEMAHTLIAHGADVRARAGNRNVAYYARLSGNHAIIDDLRAQGVVVVAVPQANAIPLNMAPPEPIPQPNPVIDHPEHENYPPAELPTIQIPPIPNETDVFDTLMASDTPFQEVFEDDDNLIFRYGHTHGVNAAPNYNYFSYPRSELLNSLSKNEQLRFPCTIITEGLPNPEQVDMDTIYFIITGPQRFMVPLSHIVGWIHNPAIRIFDIVDTGATTGTLTSWHSIVEEWADGLPYGFTGQQITTVSVEHCNPGTEKRVYNLAILQMAEAAEGGRRRRHRSRKHTVPRRRKTHKRRQQKTHRKQKKVVKKRAHRTKKRSTK